MCVCAEEREEFVCVCREDREEFVCVWGQEVCMHEQRTMITARAQCPPIKLAGLVSQVQNIFASEGTHFTQTMLPELDTNLTSVREKKGIKIRIPGIFRYQALKAYFRGLIGLSTSS